MSQPRRRPIAILKLPRYQVPLLLVRAGHIVESMTANAWFPAPVPSLATVQAAIDDLRTAETATPTGRGAAIATRDEKRVALVQLLQRLASHVQTVADANPDNAVSLIESAGMFVKNARGPGPRVFTVQEGPTSGTIVVLVPKAADRADAYEFARSTDGSVTWVSQPVETHAKATFTGLTPGTTVLFRYRARTKDGWGDWCDAVSIMVR